MSLLENSLFDKPASEAAPHRIPWWRTVAGEPRVEWERRTEAWGPVELATLVLPAGSAIEQPLAVPPGLVGDVTVSCMVDGGALSVRDESGRELRLRLDTLPERPRRPASSTVGSSVEVRHTFQLRDLPGWKERPLAPRLVVRLEVAEGEAEARFPFMFAYAPVPAVSEEELRAEIVSELEWIFSQWFERGLDRVGPRETAFLSTVFDARTGASLMHLEGGAHPFYGLLARALAVHENPQWRARYEAYLSDWFELGFHPETGLPRVWNVEQDVPNDETPREIAFALGQLLDVVEKGPEAWRERALAQAVRIGEVVLAKGVLPDGEIAARYRPRDGATNMGYPPLRRLDVPSVLARLGAAAGDERFTNAARDAFVQFEFTHHWPGTWDAIDPGFDDNFGNYGARALRAWEAHPDEAAFRNIALGGARHYLPIWRDALQLGGNIAADQVRCWKILRDVAHLEPELRAEISELLLLAGRNHFRGQQYAGGTWGDVTIHGFDPQAYLEVGDLPGMPRNLLEGLAITYDDELRLPYFHRDGTDLRTPEQRALFTAVFRSSREHYKREFGYLAGRTERAGANPAGGGVRMAAGLVEMLRQLESEPR